MRRRKRAKPRQNSLPILLPPKSKSVKPPYLDTGEIDAAEDEGKPTLDWLISAFPSISLVQIDSVHRETGGDPYKAAGILGSEIVDLGDCNGSYGKKRSVRKKKNIATSTGMVSGVIGKDYSRSASTFGGPMEMKGHVISAYSCEEAEEFLCSMLGVIQSWAWASLGMHVDEKGRM